MNDLLLLVCKVYLCVNTCATLFQTLSLCSVLDMIRSMLVCVCALYMCIGPSPQTHDAVEVQERCGGTDQVLPGWLQ